ncbi:hypothetical protein FOVG_10264 [Fusarium oxysporum f. sp. pisi HDV247]|uniref:Uncharacterized protein n=1 Tax=Fusarium oxysporum f. sp. pisi HDV247 TaxID=1080344 RepID=W9P813_FUSOX|nr:hypothetical protein FOVG_10264 [Fusarium oxysporum f. sp. pisi HDV247]
MSPKTAPCNILSQRSYLRVIRPWNLQLTQSVTTRLKLRHAITQLSHTGKLRMNITPFYSAIPPYKNTHAFVSNCRLPLKYTSQLTPTEDSNPAAHKLQYALNKKTDKENYPKAHH